MFTNYAPRELTIFADSLSTGRGSAADPVADEIIFARDGDDFLENNSGFDLYLLGGTGTDQYYEPIESSTIVHETGDDALDVYTFIFNPASSLSLTSQVILDGDMKHLFITDATSGGYALFIDWEDPSNRIEQFNWETPTSGGTISEFFTYDGFRDLALDTPLSAADLQWAGDGRNPTYLGETTLEGLGLSRADADALRADIELATEIDFGPRDAKTIAYMYQVAFNRAPDQVGLNFWIDQRETYAASFGNGGLTEREVAEYFLTVDEFASRYGTNGSLLNNEQFVTELYTNQLQRAPDIGGLNFWTSVLDQNNPDFDRVELLIQFASADELRTTDPLGFETTIYDSVPGIQLETNPAYTTPDWIV